MRPFPLIKTFGNSGKFFGFTLLELLISMSLLIVLISIIWSLIRIYSGYYAAGTRRVDRSQLVRSLSQLLGDDLGAAIQDPIHPLPPSLAAGDIVRRFGLLGTANSLRVDVIQINPLAPGSEVYFTRQATTGPTQNVRMQVPELKTIYYDFFSLTTQSPGKQSGLVRREESFESPGQTNTQSNTQTNTHLPAADIGVDPLVMEFGPPVFPFGPPTIAEQLLHEDDPRAMWAPEIVEIRFRYSDGANWQDSWNSLDKNGLPVAVEVTMKIMPVEDIEKLRRKSSLLPLPVTAGPDQTESFNDLPRSVGSPLPMTPITPMTPEAFTVRPPARTLESLIEELGLAAPTEQRLVVYLATSPLIRSNPIRRPGPASASRPPRTPTISTPRALPRPTTPSPTPSQPTAPTQQWLRK